MRKGLGLLCLLGLALLSTDAVQAAENWPSFRGPLHTGVAPDADPPVEWSEEKNVRWKVELEGVGHASPVVWGDRIYISSALRTTREAAEEAMPAMQQRRGGREPRSRPTRIHQFIVSAYDLKSGERRWKQVVREEIPHESLHATASQASASPVTDGRHVWAFFGSRGLYCLDAKSGKVVWERDLGTQSTRNEFGEGASPVVHGDLVIVNWDHEGDSFIVAYDKKSGEERWRAERDEPTSWSTPLVVADGEREIVVVSAANAVRGYDLESGDVVWSLSGLGLNVVPTPVADDETIWVMSGWREAHGMALRYPGARGDLTGSDRVRWESGRGLSYVPSALLLDGRLYFYQRFTGILSCYALETGKPCFAPDADGATQRRIDELENIYASPVAAGDRIYTVSRDGETVVLRAGKKGVEILARNSLDDVFNATPAVVGETILLRGDRHLYAIAED